MECVYSSGDLQVHFRRAPTDTVAVTFSNWTSVQPRPLWEKHIGTSAMFFVALRNHWYQTPDVDAAIQTVMPLISGFDNRIVMGSSMGGFAAVALAERFGATRSIAISPQISLDPVLAPFEKRWRAELATINEWRHRISSSSIPAHIFFDPKHSMDNAHSTAIATEHQSTILWALPYSGHPAGFALADLNLLEHVIHDAVGAGDDVEECRLFSLVAQEYEKSAHRSATVAINDFRYGQKRALAMAAEDIDALQGHDSTKRQLIGYIDQIKSRLTADEGVPAK
ncbi:hypothetical protein [Sinorhizobium alkalisoli]|uniref:hypothetical protein n=1 Tax=Sinorhizobium alkalisoli TaxID=1752398 RepID=UPI00124C2453|nr:hypothetical protein [Sinorhizobium alkalisoli]